VPNPSFESYTACPFGSFQIDKVNSWSNAGGSPDYFNSCALSGGASVPNNFYGYQNAANGNAYVGLYTYNKGVPFPSNREHIQAVLNTPLTIGVKYFVSFDVSFTLDNIEIGFAADKLGVLFTNVANYNSGNQPNLNNNSQVYIDTVILDTSNWYHVEGSFIADSSYQRLLVGNFFDDSNTDTLGIDTALYTAYYYIDNVCVSSDSNDCLVVTGIKDSKPKTELKLYPNPTKSNSIWLELNSQFQNKDVRYRIFNEIGQMVTENSFYSNSSTEQINFNHLPKGIYYLKITNGLEQASHKFIIN